jgi:hypothetical protein
MDALLSVMSRGLKTEGFESVEVKWKQAGIPKSCFYNAVKFVLDNPKFSYALGIMFYRGIPVEHAWVVDENGVHFEVTLKVVDSAIDYYPVKVLPYQELVDTSIALGGNPPEIFTLSRFKKG